MVFRRIPAGGFAAFAIVDEGALLVCKLLDFGLFLQDKKSKEEFFPEVIPSSLSQVVFYRYAENTSFRRVW